MSELTPEQVQEINQTRAALRHGFEQVFSNLASYLQKLNLHPQMKTFCLMNFDQGAFWAREGIASMPLSFQPKEATASKEGKEEKKEEAVSSEEKPQDKPTELKEAV